MSENCLETKNFDGEQVVFTEKQRENKSAKHPELREKSFIVRIKEAIESPDFVYKDLANSNRFVYYVREFKINSRVVYTKVVIQSLKTHLFVITAYRPDYVKERGKAQLIYGNDQN